jgi:carbon storage regulator CsrA
MLRRGVGEAIVIQDKETGRTLATVRMMKLGRQQMKLGVDAPEDVLILREELITKGKP